MIKLYSLLLTVTITTLSVFAQTPHKMSYQTVIRDSEGRLVVSRDIGMRISILQGSAMGTAVYTETRTPVSNANGLVTFEIGGNGTNSVTGAFSAIDWSDGPYFVKTETDPSGGISYTITGTSQLLTVPYAFHAKTAETISVPIVESDPLFAAWDRSAGIEITESQVSDLKNYYLSSNPDGFITAYIVTKEDVTAHESALSITESQITDLQSYLTSITGQSVGDLADVDLAGIEAGKVLKYDAVAQKWVVSDDLGLTEETDPAVTANFDFTDAADGDLLQFNGTKWVKLTPGYISDYTVTETDVTAHQAALTISEAQISDLGNYIETETDPSVLKGTQAGEMQYWNGTEWETVAPPGASSQTLYFINGKPQWGPLVGPTDVMNSSTGKVWMDRNLGAGRVATSSSDAEAYGDLYQWGRAADGHQIRTSGTTTTLSSSDTPGHASFIMAPNSPNDWRSLLNNNLWQGISGTNNPCPERYRLPTGAEWAAEWYTWNSMDDAGAFGSPLKLPNAGARDPGNASLISVGTFGYYWSSTVSGAHIQTLYFASASYYGGLYPRARGNSVRCIKD
jgi:uncharacterized protein (TIGR02145 family)